jgi:hypothetical protein
VTTIASEPQSHPTPAAPVGPKCAGVGAGAADLADLPTERLEHEIERHAAAQNAGMCRWLELVAEFERRQAWATWGCLTCAHWVSWRCSVSLRAARDHVRVAGSLRELELLHAEFRAGRLSYSKVRALSRVATPDNEEELLELATHATASQLDVLVRAYSRASAVQAGDTHRHRYVSWFWESDGSLSIKANLPAEDGAAVIAGIEATGERLREEQRKDDHADDSGGSAEPPESPRVSRADALVAMAQDAIGPERAAVKPADRNMVVVHVDLDALAEAADSGRARCHIREGPGIASDTARRLACDASVVTLLERDGEPLSVGRRTRSIPPAMRRAVDARDGGCRFPGCHHRRYVDAHHIHHWACGGETSAANLVMLCRRHHRLVHEGGFAIERGPTDGSLVFRRPDGVPLEASPTLPPAPAGISAPELGAGPLRAGSGERMNLDYAVLAMFTICERGSRSRAAPV